MVGKRHFLLIFLLITGLAYSLFTQENVSAGVHSPQGIPTPSELINAVNNLRLSYGLPPLSVHPVLMEVAQSQAEVLANSSGASGHSRPNGMTLQAQLISLGYPLSGDLSLGGYRSENWVAASTVEQAIQFWMGDDAHMNTMLSTNRSDIGAGVAEGGDGQVYCVIETALQTSSGQQQSGAADLVAQPSNSNATTGSSQNGVAEYMMPVVLSTALPNGDVYHTVQYGQSLWSIAITYKTKIKSIQALNNLGEGLIVYDGQKLLVLKGATQPAPASPTAAPVSTMTPAPLAMSSTPTIEILSTATIQPTQTADAGSNAKPSSSKFLVIVLIVAAFIGAGMAVWLIRDPNSG